ncbi:hypothetical protein [Peribacillus loiseleuriae]|uniref:Lipoprotein n=1 Tax=Peribacillus loiseleuriae TaxID=1679170 RepID=A0A0K9GUV7_9BACI|nr:hypothetical protein [Peribacillus loiseleuriae]KMY50440.1 hypothetical protein AC625_13795 [Peribacillus loiseleuriae]
MSRSLILVGICSSIILLGSCSFFSVHNTDEDKFLEMAIIDENLQLKSKVAELEEQIIMLEKNQQTAFGINDDVFLFIKAIETKDLVELKNRVAVNVSIESTGITFDNGNSLRYGFSKSKDCIDYMKLKDHEINFDKGTFVYEVFSVGNKTEAKHISVEVVQQENGWKINNVTGEI